MDIAIREYTVEFWTSNFRLLKFDNGCKTCYCFQPHWQWLTPEKCADFLGKAIHRETVEKMANGKWTWSEWTRRCRSTPRAKDNQKAKRMGKGKEAINDWLGRWSMPVQLKVAHSQGGAPQPTKWKGWGRLAKGRGRRATSGKWTGK